jgi:aminoglycoside phosphotransferase (APT) family kinase protein
VPTESDSAATAETFGDLSPRTGTIPTMRDVLGVGRTAQVLADKDGAVVKLFFDWVPIQLIDAEERATAAAVAASAPAPRLLGRVERENRAGLVLERVDGPSMLAELTAHPWQILTLATRLARLQADIHACAGVRLPVLRERLRSRIELAAELSGRARDWSLARLDTLPDGDHLLHGDLHPDNVILATRGAVAIDWMAAARGDSAADAARTALILELGAPPPGISETRRVLIAAGRRAFRARWLEAYVRASMVRPADITAWRPVVAAARLGDNIHEEKRRLCAIVESAAAADS